MSLELVAGTGHRDAVTLVVFVGLLLLARGIFCLFVPKSRRDDSTGEPDAHPEADDAGD